MDQAAACIESRGKICACCRHASAKHLITLLYVIYKFILYVYWKLPNCAYELVLNKWIRNIHIAILGCGSKKP